MYAAVRYERGRGVVPTTPIFAGEEDAGASLSDPAESADGVVSDGVVAVPAIFRMIFFSGDDTTACQPGGRAHPKYHPPKKSSNNANKQNGFNRSKCARTRHSLVSPFTQPNL